MASVGTRLVRAAAWAVTLAVGLAACAAPRGAAAVVDDDVITEAYLAETAADIAPFSDASPTSLLQALVVGPTWIEVASEAGYGASEQEARAVLEQLAADLGLDSADVDPGPGLLTIAQVTAAQDKVNAAGAAAEVSSVVEERVAESQIEVSPRYGEWVSEQGRGIVPIAWPWLVTTAPPAE